MLRLKMGMVRLCANEEIFCDFVRHKKDMMRLCATQKRYVATLRDPKKIRCIPGNAAESPKIDDYRDSSDDGYHFQCEFFRFKSQPQRQGQKF